MMDKPTNIVFLDTSIYVKQKFNFSSNAFTSMAKAARIQSLSVVIPEVTEREIKRKITEIAEKAAHAIGNVARNHSHTKYLEGSDILTQEPSGHISKLTQVLNTQFDEFISHFSVERLSLSTVSLSPVVDWYFTKQPPFAEGKKSKEFPDAFVVSSLDAYCSRTGNKVAVISTDGDFKSASAKRDHFEYFESIPAYLEAIQQYIEQVPRIHNLLKTKVSDLQDIIKEHFTEISFSIEQDWQGDVEDVVVEDISIDNLNVLEIENEAVTIAGEAQLDYSAELSYDDYSTASYDSSEGDVFIHHRIHQSINDSVDCSFTIIFQSDQDWADIKEITIKELNPSHIEIDADEYDIYY